METNQLQIETLVAIVDRGTFDAAASQLHITPSAVSQRIRALEHSVGRLLVTRATPCRPTAAGEVLVRAGRQSQLLYNEARRSLAADRSTELTVVVNADSLATWFRDVLDEAASWDRVALRLHVEDQAHSHELLRSGDVLAAVTSEPEPVQGCTVERLGSLRYVAAASPAFTARWCHGRTPPWREMPMVIFNDKDTLQHDMLRLHGVSQPPPVVHRVPASADFQEALRRGLGWGAMPEPQFRDDVAEGRLVRLASRHKLDITLYWQHWRLQSTLLAGLTDVVRRAARAHLRP
ncbi:MAG TPA: LysR family transcriptional regulator ArgP [Acidothermaceae bacterium]|jgi:LysR family transcriptional regulator (chromosome initiation inhibitor)|nr:LysR family transcriptional regulator ArgP [Acidothermaceae bacterium]